MDSQKEREQQLRERFEHASEKELEALLLKGGLERFVAQGILTERRRELRRSARIIAWATVVTAIATVVAALAAWTAIFFQFWHTPPNESRQPPASIAPTPSSSP